MNSGTKICWMLEAEQDILLTLPDRYDDHDDIRTNLIESYDRLMEFIAEHLPEKFHLEGDQRINLRGRIFREVIGNVLIHRESTNPYPAKLIIEKDQVFTENLNNPHGRGNIDPENFSPYPKNPMIARFFKEIGRVDELAAGVRNTYKYVVSTPWVPYRNSLKTMCV